MDFLEIRKRAKERVTARLAAAAAPARPPDGPGTPPPDGFAARLEALPPADAERFTTWRPGDGEPPLPLDAAAYAPRATAAPIAELDGPAPPERPAPAPEPALAPASRADAPASPLDAFFYRPDEEAPALPDLGGGAAPVAEGEADASALEEYLTFLLGGEEYAVAIDRVREVLKAPPITEVPRAPADILGVVTVRGEVVAVIDPRGRLGLPPSTLGEGAGRIVLVSAEEGTCALLVDRVASVVRLRPGSIEPCPQGIAGASTDCLAGIGRERDRLFTVLQIGALLRRVPAPPRRPGEGVRHGGG